MNIRTIGWLATALCTIGFAGAAALRIPTRTDKTEKAPAKEPAKQAPGVTVLGYGSIGTEEGSISPETFAEQMHYLSTAGLTPVSLADFMEWKAGKKALPERPVLLTFENADKGFMTSVLPVLRERRYPFVLFVDTRSLGSMPGYMTERDLGVVSRMGGEVGVCSRTQDAEKEWQQAELRGNAALNTLSESELGAPSRRLGELSGAPCHVFSHFSPTTDVTILRELVRSGYEAAFSRKEGKATPDSPSFQIPRYMVNTQSDFARAFGIFMPEPARAIIPDSASVDFEDDCVAIDDDEPAETPQQAPKQPEKKPKADSTAKTTPTPEPAKTDDGEAAAEEPPLDIIPTTPITPTYANLGRRTEGGDWVTASFTQPLVPREQTQVAVLGYHNFSNTKSITAMRMRTHVFCKQMQFIRENNLAVISMKDFMEWRLGTRQLPARCVLITIDDGWKSVYTDAYPILKAYGYPFTIFLYTKYIDVQGDSMTTAQIKEMQAYGATVGSHSTNHLYPRSWRKLNNKPEEYAEQVQREIIDSGTVLTEKFGPCTTYCYPGGYNTPQMLEALKASPLRLAFTVLERKVACTEDPLLVHRYMVFGNDHRIFRRAVTFEGDSPKDIEQKIEAADATARAFFPKAFTGIPAPAGQPQTPPAQPAPENADGTPAENTATDTATTPAPAKTPRKGRKKSKGRH